MLEIETENTRDVSKSIDLHVGKDFLRPLNLQL